MAPCVVVQRLQGKQQCSRAPAGEHAEVQAQDAECGCHEQQEVNEKRPKPRNNQSHNHDSAAPRQHPLIFTGAGPIHPVHGPLRLPATEAMPRKDSHFRHFGGLFSAGLEIFVLSAGPRFDCGRNPVNSNQYGFKQICPQTMVLNYYFQ